MKTTFTLVLLSMSLFSMTFISKKEKLPKFIKNNYIFVPSGNAVIDKDTVSVNAFYLFRYEMSNANYQEFLNDLSKNGKDALAQNHAVRSENWNNFMDVSSAKFTELYFTHPAFRDYPVVNVTHKAALAYCAWLEEIIAPYFLAIGKKIKVRLPHRAEIVRAGVMDNQSCLYPWGTKYMQNTKGDYLCNFRAIPNSALSRDENGQIVKKGFVYDIHEAADLTAPVNSYWPSALGFYNLSGNVAEMIMEPGLAVGGSFTDLGYDVRLQSMQRYEDASCNVGFRVALSVE